MKFSANVVKRASIALAVAATAALIGAAPASAGNPGVLKICSYGRILDHLGSRLRACGQLSAFCETVRQRCSEYSAERRVRGSFVTEQLEDVLRRIQRTLAADGAAEAAEGLSGVIAAAVANELHAALERGDMEVAEFHADILESQVVELPLLKCQIGQ